MYAHTHARTHTHAHTLAHAHTKTKSGTDAVGIHTSSHPVRGFAIDPPREMECQVPGAQIGANATKRQSSTAGSYCAGKGADMNPQR